MKDNSLANLIKEDIEGISYGDFRPLSSRETYGVGLNFIIKYALLFTIMHVAMVFIAFHLGVKRIHLFSTTDIFYCVISNLFSGLIIVFFSMEYIMFYAYLKKKMKSLRLIKVQLWKLCLIYIFMHLSFDFYRLLHEFESFAGLVFFNSIPCIIACTFIIKFEFERLALGPLINLIADKVDTYNKGS